MYKIYADSHMEIYIWFELNFGKLHICKKGNKGLNKK